MTAHSSLINIFHQGETLNAKRCTILLYANQKNENVYVIVSGVAYSYRYGAHREKIVHTFYGPGDILPISAIRRSEINIANFETLTDTKLHSLPAKLFLEQLQTNVTAAYDFSQQITDQYAHYVQRVGNLQYTSAYDRVVYCLLLLTQRFGTRYGEQGVKLDIPLTHNLIASTVNVARETASRCLKRLIQKELISKSGKLITISDIHLLSRELHDSTFDPISLLS